MSDAKKKFWVGQQLYWVSNSRHGSNHHVTVESIGRKWIGISGRRRISAETMVHDGGQYAPAGRCYFSEEEHDAEMERNREWELLLVLTKYRYPVPAHLTTEMIRAVIALLEPPKEHKE